MRYLAEFIGTMVLVLMGIGAWTFAGGVIGVVGVGLAFGFAFMTMYYIFSTTWGAHFNPAITFGKWVAGDITFIDGVWQVLCQFAGAIVGVLFVYIIAYNQIDVPGVFVLGQNGWGVGYGAEYNIWGVMLFELIASFVFRLCRCRSRYRSDIGHFGHDWAPDFGRLIQPGQKFCAGVVFGRHRDEASLVIFDCPNGRRFTCRFNASLFAVHAGRNCVCGR